jgi:hypothetical protein
LWSIIINVKVNETPLTNKVEMHYSKVELQSIDLIGNRCSLIGNKL